MNIKRLMLGTAAIAGMLAPSAAMAGATRSTTALPSVQAAQQAPISGVRASKALHRKSNQTDGSAATGYILSALVAAGVVGAVVLVASDDDPQYNTPVSPG